MKTKENALCGAGNAPRIAPELSGGTKSQNSGVTVKTQSVFLPDNLEWILSLPFRTKVLAKYKKAVNLLAYVLNHTHTAQYTRDDQSAPISYFTAAVICGGDKHTWSDLQDVLLAYDIVKHDGVCKKGEKAYHYKFGAAMNGVKWNRSKQLFTFKLPEPKNDLKKEEVSLTINTKILPAALEYTALEYPKRTKKDWSDDKRKFWDWYMSEGFHTAYDINKTGRVYGGWSNVPRELRGTFLINGEEVRENDISNCQPLFLANLYGDSAAEEKARYMALVESGLFYESVMEVTGKDREETKVEVMTFLCGKKVPAVSKYFESNFPFLAGLILAKYKESYKELAYNLQKWESDIIVKQICAEFPAVSMHDGVIVPASMAGKVNSRIKEVIFAEYGLNANVKIENKTGYN